MQHSSGHKGFRTRRCCMCMKSPCRRIFHRIVLIAIRFFLVHISENTGQDRSYIFGKLFIFQQTCGIIKSNYKSISDKTTFQGNKCTVITLPSGASPRKGVYGFKSLHPHQMLWIQTLNIISDYFYYMNNFNIYNVIPINSLFIF